MARWGLVLIAAAACGCGDVAQPEEGAEERPTTSEASTDPDAPPAPVAQPAQPSELPPEAEPSPAGEVAEPGGGVAPSVAPPAPTPAPEAPNDPIADCRRVVAQGGSYSECICRAIAERVDRERASGNKVALSRHMERYLRECPVPLDRAPYIEGPGDYPPHVPMRQPARDDHPYGPLDRAPRLH